MNLSVYQKSEIKRFLKYFLIGFLTFVFDLALLFLMVESIGLSEGVSASLAFYVAVSINYYYAKKHAFSETKEDSKKTYIKFIILATFIGLAIGGFMEYLVNIKGYNYLWCRIGIGAIAGIFGYLINLFFNFKVHR